MRTLKFIVDGQSIKKDPSCDFKGLVPGTKGYLEAHFQFSDEWKNCKKAAVFGSLGQEYAVPLINGKCEIPEKALTWRLFSVKVAGIRDGYRITTNKVEVLQNG